MSFRDAVETVEVGNAKVAIYVDEDATNPREVDVLLSTFAHWHRDYDLGERKATEAEMYALRRGGFPLLARYLRASEGAVVVLPVSLLDHSGLTLWLGGGPHWSDTAGWDSGTVGFVYATADRARELEIGPEHAIIEAVIETEMEEYGRYVAGECFGYVIEDRHGQVVDSCWGFIGFDYCMKEAQDAAKNEYLQATVDVVI